MVSTAPAWLILVPHQRQPRAGQGWVKPHHAAQEAVLHATTHSQSITLHHLIKLLVYLFILLLRLGGQGERLVRLRALTLPVLLVQRLGKGPEGDHRKGEEGSPHSA